MTGINELTANILRSGRYNSYKQIADKIGVSDRFLRYLRNGERSSAPAEKKLKNIWRGIKRTPYIYVYIALQKANMYFFGGVARSVVKHDAAEFSGFFNESVEIVLLGIYQAGTVNKLDEAIIEEWLEEADSYGEDFINRDDFKSMLYGELNK